MTRTSDKTNRKRSKLRNMIIPSAVNSVIKRPPLRHCFAATVMISCRETGETSTRQFVTLERGYYDYQTKIELSVCNDTLSPVTGNVVWKLCTADGKTLQSGQTAVTVQPFSVLTLDEIDFNKTDVENNYVWYEFDGGKSFGSVLFTAPKHFKFADPKLKVMRSGDLITVTADKYASQVEIYSPTEDFILSDNFFDMQPGSRTLKILGGDPKELYVRSVYDIG